MTTQDQPAASGPTDRPETSQPHGAPVVVGVFLQQPAKVVRTAAEVASWTGSELVCCYADAIGPGQVMPDGTIVPLVLASEPAPEGQPPDPELLETLRSQLEGCPVPWRVRELVGDPTEALTEIATEESARMIVVGTRQPGFAGTVREFFNGSVAARLAHRQNRPVLVVPLNPVDADAELPWSQAETS